jgi:non-homologous end joining protein Ku
MAWLWNRRGPSRSTSSSTAPRSIPISHPAVLPASDGKVGHDAFAVIRETIREMDKVAIGRVVLTNREHIIALPLDKGLMDTLLRYPYAVRDPQEYFDDILDVKVTKDMLDLRQAHRQSEGRPLRARQLRRPVRNRPRRSHQPEARR